MRLSIRDYLAHYLKVLVCHFITHFMESVKHLQNHFKLKVRSTVNKKEKTYTVNYNWQQNHKLIIKGIPLFFRSVNLNSSSNASGFEFIQWSEQLRLPHDQSRYHFLRSQQILFHFHRIQNLCSAFIHYH